MLVTVSQAARELGVSTEHARRMFRSGKWPTYKLGTKATRVDVGEIRQLARLRGEAKNK